MTGYLAGLLAREHGDVGMQAIAPRVPSLYEPWPVEGGAEPIAPGTEVQFPSPQAIPHESGMERGVPRPAPMAGPQGVLEPQRAGRDVSEESTERHRPPAHVVPMAVEPRPAVPAAAETPISHRPAVAFPLVRASVNVPDTEAASSRTQRGPRGVPPASRPLRPATAAAGEVDTDPGSGRELRRTARPDAALALAPDPVVPREALAPSPRWHLPESAPVAAGTETVVEVTIGRIEVRGVPAPAPPQARPEPAARGPQPLSLDEYLRQRARGSR